MSMDSIEQKLIETFQRLSIEQQKQVIEFAQGLSQEPLPPGAPGETLLARMGTFRFAPGELETIAQAIEEDCERVDPGEW